VLNIATCRFFCNIRMRFVILSTSEYNDDDEDSGIGTTTLLVFTKAKKWILGYTVPLLFLVNCGRLFDMRLSNEYDDDILAE